MTKPEEIRKIIAEIGRPAYGNEIGERLGIDAHTVCSYLSPRARREAGIGSRLVSPKNSQRKNCALYFLVSWGDDLKKVTPQYKRYSRVERNRPITDIEEFLWHCRKIKEYGLMCWAEIVNRDSEDLRQKICGGVQA